MSLNKKEYININPDRILFHKLLHELKCSFLIWLHGNSFFSSIEVTDFSSQLHLVWLNLQDLNVCDVIIVAVQQKVPMATDIIP